MGRRLGELKLCGSIYFFFSPGSKQRVSKTKKVTLSCLSENDNCCNSLTNRSRPWEISRGQHQQHCGMGGLFVSFRVPLGLPSRLSGNKKKSKSNKSSLFPVKRYAVCWAAIYFLSCWNRHVLLSPFVILFSSSRHSRRLTFYLFFSKLLQLFPQKLHIKSSETG